MARRRISSRQPRITDPAANGSLVHEPMYVGQREQKCRILLSPALSYPGCNPIYRREAGVARGMYPCLPDRKLQGCL